MPDDEQFPLEHLEAIRREDLAHVARSMSLTDLEKMKVAEEVFELHYRRRNRGDRLAAISQAVLALVAVGGILENAYQTYSNNVQQHAQQRADQERWAREFQRAQAADKYRAFFETSALATDAANPDKRLVGYALLQEFVQDHDYNAKATLLLEQALQQELSRDKDPGLGEEAQSAITTILRSLSDTNDCKALQNAARSVDLIARRLGRNHDSAEATEVFGLYVRALAGRASLACGSLEEVREVWGPLREALQKNPGLGGLGPKAPTAAEAAVRLVEILRDRCLAEVEVAGSSDCPEIFARYAHHCAVQATQKNPKACQILIQTSTRLAAKQASAGLLPGLGDKG